ncbi:hypothetical protein GGR56DRAFT_660908 [Xylariaceae sp. FL0804]|nr:hypothetical protein GGR56DRAFT_660908 [Xylariaceae sp. FL0804]
MSGLEIVPIALAGISAATGLVSAAKGVCYPWTDNARTIYRSDMLRCKQSSSSSSHRTVTTTSRNESAASRQDTFTYSRGPAEAYSSRLGSYSRSCSGGSAAAGSSWAYKSSGYWSSKKYHKTPASGPPRFVN